MSSNDPIPILPLPNVLSITVMSGFVVIEVDTDLAAREFPHQPHVMPIVIPGRAVFVLGYAKRGASLTIMISTTVGIWFRPQVNIVEMLVVLIAKEDTAVAMIASIFGCERGI